MNIYFSRQCLKYLNLALPVLVCFCLIVPPCQAQKKTHEPVSTMANTYPFSEAAAVAILAYPDRVYWDTADSFSEGPQHVIGNGGLEQPGLVQQRRMLNKQETKKVFNALYNYRKCTVRNSYGCYEPRHLILFYNKDREAFAWIELCFDCLNTMTSSDRIPAIYFCREKMEALKRVFLSLGIRYYGKDSVEAKYEKEYSKRFELNVPAPVLKPAEE